MPLKISCQTTYLRFNPELTRKLFKPDDFCFAPMSAATPCINVSTTVQSPAWRRRKTNKSGYKFENMCDARSREPNTMGIIRKQTCILHTNSVNANQTYGTLDVTKNCEQHFWKQRQLSLHLRARLSNAWSDGIFVKRCAQPIVFVSATCLKWTPLISVYCKAKSIHAHQLGNHTCDFHQLMYLKRNSWQ